MTGVCPLYTSPCTAARQRHDATGRRDPERFVFVRDGFHFWAFLLAPLWLLWHRLWLVLVDLSRRAIRLIASRRCIMLACRGAQFRLACC